MAGLDRKCDIPKLEATTIYTFEIKREDDNLIIKFVMPYFISFTTS